MNNQPAIQLSHDDFIANLQWCAFNGYVPADDVVRGQYEWERHGNPEQWIDIRWNRDEIERHHREYVIASTLARLDNVARERIWRDLEGEL
jgi:hypothetical protein